MNRWHEQSLLGCCLSLQVFKDVPLSEHFGFLLTLFVQWLLFEVAFNLLQKVQVEVRVLLLVSLVLAVALLATRLRNLLQHGLVF